MENCYEGLYYVRGQGYCSCCEERCSEEDLTYVESVSEQVCNACLCEFFFPSDYSDEYFPQVDCEEVYSSGYTEVWTANEAENYAVWVEVRQEWWNPSDVYETQDGEHITDNELTSGDYFICIIDNLAWEIKYLVETKDGPVSKENIAEEAA